MNQEIAEGNMKIWLLEQNVNCGYDTFDACVVLAETEEKAKEITPGMTNWTSIESARVHLWADPEHVIVTCLGEYKGDRRDDPVICASFNAG